MSMRDNSKTNVQITRKTRDALIDLGKKGDTYDDIIRMLIKNFKENK